MKNVLLISLLVILSKLSFGQNSNYNEKLAKFITEFKYNSTDKEFRDNFIKRCLYFI